MAYEKILPFSFCFMPHLKDLHYKQEFCSFARKNIPMATLFVPIKKTQTIPLSTVSSGFDKSRAVGWRSPIFLLGYGLSSPRSGHNHHSFIG